MMNRAAYTEIWFINNFMLSPARDGSVTVTFHLQFVRAGGYTERGETSIGLSPLLISLLTRLAQADSL